MELTLFISLSLLAPVLYLLILSIYRVTFHPLAKYPGPWLAKITNYYAAYHAYIGDLHLDMWACHGKYGPYVRYGPDKLLANSAEALKDVYGHAKNVQKSASYISFLAQKDAWSTHSVINKFAHGRKRRIMGHGFSESALKASESHLLDRVRVFCDKLVDPSAVKAGTWSKARNLADWANYLTFDVMAALVFDKSFNMLESEKNRFIVDSISNSTHRVSIIFQSPDLGSFPDSYFGIDKVLFRSMVQGRMALLKTAKAMSAERLQSQDKSSRDILSYLVNAKDPETGTGYSPQELFGESLLLIAAGSDTSSTAIAATLYYLVRNPSSYDAVASEIRTTFSDVEEIRLGPQLSHCIYIRACIDEAMRMTPPLGGAMWREVSPGGAKFDTEFLPAGLDLGVPTYALHHHPKYYPDPFSYKPERWIVSETNSKEAVDMAKSAFHPFSIGARGCIGKNLAYTELTIALARVLWLYDFKPAAGDLVPIKKRHKLLHDNEFPTEDHFTQWKFGPMLQFKARDL